MAYPPQPQTGSQAAKREWIQCHHQEEKELLETSEMIACVTSRSQNLKLGFETLKQLKGKVRRGGLFHTDKENMYKHLLFGEKLTEKGLEQSLSRKGNCCSILDSGKENRN